MQCVACKSEIRDGVQCSVCNNLLDFGCANISETTWRRYGPEKRSQWRCSACRTTSTAASHLAEPPASLESIMKELREVKCQLANISELKDDMRIIKKELSDLKDTCVYTSEKVDELGGRLTNVETRVTNLERLQDAVHSLQNELTKTRLELAAQEQRSRLNNIEIKGVPVNKDENLFTIVERLSGKVNYAVPRSQINYISRVPMHNSKEMLIIVSFLNRYIKEDFIAAARTNKLVAADIGFQGVTGRVYVNDHLSIDHKKLLTSVKNMTREKNYRYVWIKHGKIHVRRDDSSRVIVIRHENDLNRIV